MEGPLKGVRVLEMAGIGPGPFACMLLADMGASVVRVSRPGQGPSNGEAMMRGRTAVEVDLKTADGLEFVLAMAGKANILVEGFRPGVMERLGLGPDVLLQKNPALVYGRMTGYGQDGPMASEAGHDINYISISGVLGAMQRTGEKPMFPLNLVGDFGGGAMFLVMGVLAAYISSQRTGNGQIVDAAMTDGAALLGTMFHGMRSQGIWNGVGENLLDSGAHFYEVYETKDAKYMAVGAIEPQFYQSLLEGLGVSRDEFPQFEREMWPEFKSVFASMFASRDQAYWTATFSGAEACVTPVLDMFEAPDHSHHLARSSFIEFDSVRVPAPAPRFSVTPSIAASSIQSDIEGALDAWQA